MSAKVTATFLKVVKDMLVLKVETCCGYLRTSFSIMCHRLKFDMCVCVWKRGVGGVRGKKEWGGLHTHTHTHARTHPPTHPCTYPLNHPHPAPTRTHPLACCGGSCPYQEVTWEPPPPTHTNTHTSARAHTYTHTLFLTHLHTHTHAHLGVGLAVAHIRRELCDKQNLMQLIQHVGGGVNLFDMRRRHTQGRANTDARRFCGRRLREMPPCTSPNTMRGQSL